MEAILAAGVAALGGVGGSACYRWAQRLSGPTPYARLLTVVAGVVTTAAVAVSALWAQNPPEFLLAAWWPPFFVALAFTDTTCRRIPNVVVAAASAVGLLAVGLGCMFSRSVAPGCDGVLIALVMIVSCLILRGASRGGLGGGDVKFAAVYGFALGAADPGSVFASLLVGCLAAAVSAPTLRRRGIPLVAFLALGAVVVVPFVSL